MAYGLRAAVKAATGAAYVVMPLEGLWWVPDMADFDPHDKSNWLWTMMICLPDAVTGLDTADVIATVTDRKALAAGSKVRFETFAEGAAAQILHIGPYADEAADIETLHHFIADQGHALAGKHHEIYLSDARKTDPAKLRTIIRQPVTAA
ncbi:MAG: GyrI-like domain-containing protein [Acidimicrobiales bacterium]